ncbi:MAG: hypothetical protein QOH69_1474 [Actinomycetota bacterium]|jgi:hypothetical protein|nr:hypothetical protein [Actinomycetota bacterium]
MNNTTILTRALRYGTILTIGIVIVGGIIGYLVAGVPGLVSALLGAGVTAVFMGLTAASFVVASRVARLPEGIAVYYGIVLGTFILKFVIFLVLIISLRAATWLNPTIFGFTIIAAVLGTLIVDALALQRGRVPYTDVALPGESAVEPKKSSEES